MRVRYRVRCERCKVFIETGQPAVRFHKRLWHHACVHAYKTERHTADLITTGTSRR